VFPWDNKYGYLGLEVWKYDAILCMGIFFQVQNWFGPWKEAWPDIPIITQWIGTDIIHAEESIKQGQATQEQYVANIDFHTTNSEAFAEELLAILRIKPMELITVPRNHVKPRPMPRNFALATHIPDAKPEWYRVNTMIELAKKLPDVPFYFFGTKQDWNRHSPNIIPIYVENQKEIFDYLERVCVFIRYAVHDGPSLSYIEALEMGRYVINSHAYPEVAHARNDDELLALVMDAKTKHARGELPLNTRGSKEIRKIYSDNRLAKQWNELMTAWFNENPTQ